MALEEILQTRGKFRKAGSIAQRAGQADYTVLPELGQLVHQEEPQFPTNFYFDKSAFDVNQGARAMASSYINDLVTQVSRNYKEVLDNVEEKDLVGLALSVSPTGETETARKHRQYLEEAENVRKGNIKPYVEGIEHEGVKNIVAYHLAINPERILQAYEQYVGYLQSELLKEFSDKEGKLKRDKLISYLVRNTQALGDDERKTTYVRAVDMLPEPESENSN